MPSLFEWLVKERCLWHAEPMFDRDLSGHAVFRCPRCMETWPILKDTRPRRARFEVRPFEAAAAQAHPRMRTVAAAGVLEPGR